MRYKARAPLRIDFGGGWTDVAPFASEEGGAVLNAAITRYAEGYIARPETTGPLHVLRGDRSYVSYTIDVPSGSGLGSSAAQTVLWVTLVKTSIANVSDRHEIAEIACTVGSLLGILGGKQDEYASALGGITYFTFDDTVRAERLHLEPAFAEQFRSHLVLVYSGESRLSSSIHEHVWSRYREGALPVVEALRGLKRLAGDMKRALQTEDLHAFGDLLNENWAYQKELHPSVTDRRVDDIFELALRSGARGGKACGAGGGGSLLFLANPGEADNLRRSLAARKLQIFDFDFDTYGVFLKKG